MKKVLLLFTINTFIYSQIILAQDQKIKDDEMSYPDENKSEDVQST